MRIRAAATVFAAACGACEPASAPMPEDGPPIVWSGRNLDYAPEPGAVPLCAGTLQYMDRYLELAAAHLNVDELGRYLYVDGSTPQCPRVGCFHDGVVYADFAPLEHELIHAVAGELNPTGSLAFFEEGVAELLGGDHAVPHDVWVGDLRDGLAVGTEGWFPREWYPTAGTFASYVERRRGPELNATLLAETSPSTTADEAATLLEQLTATPFAVLSDDFAEYADVACLDGSMGPPNYRYPLFPCDAPEAVRPRCEGSRAVPIAVSLACDSLDALGPREGELFSYFAVDFPTDGTYRFAAEPSEAGVGARIELKKFEAGCGTRALATVYGDTAPAPLDAVFLDREVHLRAGRYSLKLARDLGPDPAIPLTLTITGDDCR